MITDNKPKYKFVKHRLPKTSLQRRALAALSQITLEGDWISPPRDLFAIYNHAQTLIKELQMSKKYFRHEPIKIRNTGHSIQMVFESIKDRKETLLASFEEIQSLQNF